MKKHLNNLWEIIQGKATRQVYQIWIWVTYFLLTTAIFTSMALYEGTYSLLEESVSSLGIKAENPKGYWIWNGSMIMGGILFIPIINFIYQKLQPIANITSKMFRWVALISCIGVIGVGSISEDRGLIHYLFAGLAFFGFMYAFCSNIYTFNKIIKSDTYYTISWLVWIVYIQLIGIMAIFLFALVQFGIYYYRNIIWIPISLPLMEWLVFLSYLMYLVVIVHILPQKKES